MGQATADELLKALAKMGFGGRRGKGSHTIHVYMVEGKKSGVRTVVADHGRPFGEGRMADYAEQLGLTRDELDQFISLEMTPEEYRAKLIERGKIRCP